ncbi:hypothetical protein [Necropsobacter rosorum]|uniref:hypothetical protein n=1 Tax=Necropsobacter rosorum TaxID=908285 RepID=UPI000509E2AF
MNIPISVRLQPPGEATRFRLRPDNVMPRQARERVTTITYWADRLGVPDDGVSNGLLPDKAGRIAAEYTLPFPHFFSFPFLSFHNDALNTDAVRQAAFPACLYAAHSLRDKSHRDGRETGEQGDGRCRREMDFSFAGILCASVGIT